LEKALADEEPAFGESGRKCLYFFSEDVQCAMDGRFRDVGVELKLKGLHRDDLMDGAIHRCLVWNLGNPLGIPNEKLEAVAIYVVRRNARSLRGDLLHCLLRVLEAVKVVDVQVLFVQEDSGNHWCLPGEGQRDPLPNWLASEQPDCGEMSQEAVLAVEALAALDSPPTPSRTMFGGKRMWSPVPLASGDTGAWAFWTDHWQMMEVGLFLRAMGYPAVRVTYSGSKGLLKPTRRGVERSVRDGMERHFGVLLDWGMNLG
jgi:hypothetical protein